jgi:hypothetical protein
MPEAGAQGGSTRVSSPQPAAPPPAANGQQRGSGAGTFSFGQVAAALKRVDAGAAPADAAAAVSGGAGVRARARDPRSLASHSARPVVVAACLLSRAHHALACEARAARPAQA